MAKYRFEQIAINCKEKVKADDIDISTYIGLEHLDPGCLHVSRWGSAVPIKGDKIIMHAGDILFGKRNAYLKRAAIAPHDGAFSAHGMIFRPREDVVDKDFFPLFIASDYFFDTAIRISVGSLSPTVNWSDLKNQEFELPDLDTQRKLAKVLWSINDTKEAYKKLIAVTDELVKSQFMELFGGRSPQSTWPMVTVGKMGENLDSKRIPITAGSRKPGPYPYYGASGIVDYIDDYILDENILLISEDGANLVARVTPIAFSAAGKIWVNNHAHVMRFENMATQTFVETYLNGISLTDYITGTAQPKLNQEKLNSIPIPCPPLPLQEQFAAFVQQSDKSKFAIQCCSNLNL